MLGSAQSNATACSLANCALGAISPTSKSANAILRSTGIEHWPTGLSVRLRALCVSGQIRLMAPKRGRLPPQAAPLSPWAPARPPRSEPALHLPKCRHPAPRWLEITEQESIGIQLPTASKRPLPTAWPLTEPANWLSCLSTRPFEGRNTYVGHGWQRWRPTYWGPSFREGARDRSRDKLPPNVSRCSDRCLGARR